MTLQQHARNMHEQVRNIGQQTSDIILVSSQVSVSTGMIQATGNKVKTISKVTYGTSNKRNTKFLGTASKFLDLNQFC